MPHLYVEYTDNLAGLPGQQLLTELNAFVCGHPSILDEADVKARLLPDKPYRSPEEFLAAMAAAPLTVLECRAER